MVDNFLVWYFFCSMRVTSYYEFLTFYSEVSRLCCKYVCTCTGCVWLLKWFWLFTMAGSYFANPRITAVRMLSDFSSNFLTTIWIVSFFFFDVCSYVFNGRWDWIANLESINQSTHAKYNPLLQQIFQINQSMHAKYNPLLQQIFQINQSMVAIPSTNNN